MNKSWEFEALLYISRGGYWVDFPSALEDDLGIRKSVRIFASFDGVEHRTSLAPKGDGTHWIYVRKEIREAINKSDGDTIHIKIELDKKSRQPEMPDDLLWLLENEPDIKTIFDKQPASIKKYLIGSVIQTKTDETRINNINKVFEFLQQRKSKS